MKSNHKKGFSIDFLEVIFLQKFKKVRQPYVDAQKVTQLWGAFFSAETATISATKTP